MKLRTRFSLSYWIRRWLKIDALEKFAIKYALRQSGIVDKLFNEINNIRTTGFLGTDLGYQEESQIILVHYNCATDSFKVIADLKFATKNETYASVAKALRELVSKYNVKFYAQHSPPVVAPLHAKIGMVTETNSAQGTSQQQYDRIPTDPKIDDLIVESGLYTKEDFKKEKDNEPK